MSVVPRSAESPNRRVSSLTCSQVLNTKRYSIGLLVELGEVFLQLQKSCGCAMCRISPWLKNAFNFSGRQGPSPNFCIIQTNDSCTTSAKKRINCVLGFLLRREDRVFLQVRVQLPGRHGRRRLAASIANVR